MAGRIPEQFIDELMARVDIVDIIDGYVPLRKSGRDYVACCPFHNEKTPSFSVSRDKQFFHCFGCGAHGTAIGFLMDYEHMEFVEAVHELASRLGLEVPTTGGVSIGPSPTQHIYQVLEQAAKFYRRQLKEHPQSQVVIDYLRQRGLNGEVAGDYGLGFAPPGWDVLTQALSQSSLQHVSQHLLDAGLLIEKPPSGGRPGRRYDRFRDRVMFPIRDTRGRVIGFGGRVLGDDTPKYLNSPETAVFHKGRELYGLYEARKAVRNLDRLLVVEGYMDVIMLACHGIRYAVATLGTATTHEHLERMFRQVPEVVFCFDGDRAGREAAWRALENLLPVIIEGRQARFMFLPEGEDPDSLVQKEGQVLFEARIVNAVPLSTFFFDALSKRVDIQSIDGYVRLLELARPLLARMQQGVLRREMVARLAERTRMSTQELSAELGGRAPVAKKSPSPSGQRQRPSLVRTAIALLIQFPQLAQAGGDIQVLRGLDKPGVSLLVEMLELLAVRPHLNSAALLEHWRDRDEGRYLQQLAAQELLLVGELEAEKEYAAALKKLCAQARDQRLEVLHSKSISADGLTDDEKNELKQLHSEGWRI
jgi:DNA primase